MPSRAGVIIAHGGLDSLDERFTTQAPVSQFRNLLPVDHCLVHVAYHRLPDWFSSNGLTLAETASRARKMRERTVPIGQFMVAAISS